VLKKIISIFLLLIISACAETPKVVSPHTAVLIISGENQYKAVRLTPIIYEKANSNLSDILIKNSEGENVPFFINSKLKSMASIRNTNKLTLVNSYVNEDDFYFDYKVAVKQNEDMITTSMEFATKETNFIKEITIYGSYDNKHWDLVQEDRIYSIDDKVKLVIQFNKPQKYTHYRLRLNNNNERVSFDTVNLIDSSTTIEEIYFIESITPSFKVESKNKTTTITVEGLKNLRLCDVTIFSDSMFQRTASTEFGNSKEIYNLALNDTYYCDMTLPLDWSISQDDTFSIFINDYDDKPINISSIKVRYYADEIVFEGKSGEEYTLEFGNSEITSAPIYDIEKYKSDILKGPIDKIEIGKISYIEEKIISGYDYTKMYNVVIVVVTIILTSIILKMLKKK